MITFGRIDDRIIHGQVVVKWLSHYPSDGALIIDDELAANPDLAQVYKNAAPPHMKVLVFSEEIACRKLPEAFASQKSYALIFKRITTVRAILEQGCPLIDSLKEVFQGPSAQRDNTLGLGHSGQFFSPEEIEAFNFVEQAGLKIIFQRIPEDKKITWAKLQKKHTTELGA